MVYLKRKASYFQKTKKTKKCLEYQVRRSDMFRHLQGWTSYISLWGFSSVQSLSHVQLFAAPGTAAHQASLSITNSQSLLKLMSIESVMPSNHLILCCPLLLPSIFCSIRVFSNESVLCIKWPKYCSEGEHGYKFKFLFQLSNRYMLASLLVELSNIFSKVNNFFFWKSRPFILIK